MASSANTLPHPCPKISGYTCAEQIYQGSHTAVYRAVQTATQRPVIIKVLRRDYPSFGELVQFRNQYTIAKNLPIPGIVCPLSLESLNNGYALIMADEGGVALEKYSQQRSLELAEVLDIALQLAGILHDLSQHWVVHKDIKPTNILIHPESKEVKLIDFSIASLLPKETQEIQSPNILEGTLAYIAPEQTGRMNRCIDYRADFYSLGVTLYQLLSGTLPFTSEDPLELIHCHLARISVPVHEVNPAVPVMVSAIVTKLMAKNAEDRYQSALGLKHDLACCLTEWETTGEISEFELGQRDLSDRFLIPEKLYGRATEIAHLLAAFERVADGASELMLVAGFSGIGKTAVVNEVHKPIVRKRGYFIKGKFDQFNRDIPLSAFVQALRDLMGQLLSESDEQLVQWRTQILTALGQNGQVLIDVIPELELIIDQQPIVTKLSGNAEQNRFNLLFQKFIEVFTTAEHPLVLFLDDLQWADLASLQLIKLLMSDNGYLLILGAYRDNEVSPIHPYILTIEEIKKANAIVNTITLAPLDFADTNHLVADTLNCSRELAKPLTELIDRKTKGNPFFITQFLQALHEEGQIRFDRDRRYWECDIVQVNALALTDDVVEFMALQLQKLPDETQHLLKLAACIGNQFDLSTLAIVAERSTNNAATALWKTLKEGLILPTSQIYKFFQEEELGDAQSVMNPTYRFLHDRVQQAAYSLIPKSQKEAVHLQIGRLLLQRIPRDERELQLFQIVNQLNCGLSLIHEAREREELAHLNWQAGEKARTASAYDAAMNYLNIGLQLLSRQCWQNQYELSLGIHQLAAEVAYLSGAYNQMTALIATGLQQAHNHLDRAKFYEVQVLALVAQNQARAAVNYARSVLTNFGVQVPKNLSKLRTILGFLTTVYRMAGKTSRDLLALPAMSNPYKIAACNLFNAIGAAAQSDIPEVLPFITFIGISLYLRYGNTPKSSMAYVIYAFLLCEKLNRTEAGYAIGKAAIELCYRSTAKVALGPTLFLWNRFIAYRKESLHATLSLLLESYQVSLEVGDVEYAAYSLCTYFTQAYLAGQNLEDLQREAIAKRPALQRLQQLSMTAIHDLNCQGLENLTMGNRDVCQLIGRFFDETKIPPSDRQLQAYTGFRKLQLAFLFHRYDLAMEQIIGLESLLEILEGTYVKTIFYFYDALVRLAQYSHLTQDRQKAYWQKVKTTYKHLSRLAKSAPVNYQHKVDLLEAECLRVQNKLNQARECYDRAITGAKANSYIQEEALANELAAKFYLDWGKEKVAAGYMQEAYYGYGRWGAKAKVQDLEQRYPELLAPILQQQQATLSAHETVFSPDRLASLTFGTQFSSSGNTSVSATLDLATVLKASQTLSSEIELDKLLAILLHTVLENAAADKGVLLIPHDNQWFVEAVATIDRPAQIQSIALSSSSEVPHSLINTVKRSREAVVIVDASAHPTLATDTYVAQQQSKSLLCTPILNQGKLVAILYLENHVTVGAFTSDRVELLNVLCAQAAISLDNARLYQQSQSYVQQLERSLLERKQAEAALIESEIYHRTLFDQASIGLVLCNMSGKLLYCNPAYAKILGRTTDELPALTYWEITPESYAEQEQLQLQSLQTTGRYGPYEKEYIHKDGHLIPVRLSGITVERNGEQCIWSNVEDIRDRKRLESEQQRLLDVLEATPDYIGLASANGRILWRNKQLRELYQDLVNYKNISECHPAWVNEIILNQIFPILMEQGSWSGELALLDSNGKEIPVSQVIIAHKSQSGEIKYLSTIMRDISDRKAYEERLEKNNAELIRAVRMKDEFLATMSHELRTPMNAILGMTELLRDEILGAINEKQFKALATVESSGNHLLGLINDILDVSKIESGQIKLDYQNTAITPLCQQSLEFIKPQAAKKSIQTKIILPANLPDLSVDERRIRQVLVNLLSNAVKFTPEGGCITLEVICPITIKQQSYLQINVKDTGIGIAAENFQKVFEPFIQVDSGLNRNYEGTGLGLALVKRIVELHQGEVMLTSELGVGSCFAIALPLN